MKRLLGLFDNILTIFYVTDNEREMFKWIE